MGGHPEAASGGVSVGVTHPQRVVVIWGSQSACAECARRVGSDSVIVSAPEGLGLGGKHSDARGAGDTGGNPYRVKTQCAPELICFGLLICKRLREQSSR